MPLTLLRGHSSFGIVSLPGYSKTVTVCMIHASTKFGGHKLRNKSMKLSIVVTFLGIEVSLGDDSDAAELPTPGLIVVTTIRPIIMAKKVALR